MVIPNWLNFLLQEKDLQTIEAKIASIERQCDIEIVPVIVKQSSDYPQTKSTLYLIIALFSLVCLFIFQFNHNQHWDSEGLSYNYQLILTTLTFFTLILSAHKLANVPGIKRSLTSSSVKDEQTFKRAELEFYKEKIQETKKQNGVLIFISLLEHRVIVRADENIQKQLPDNILWDKTVSTIIQSIRNRKLSDGIYKSLELIENELKEKLPLQGQKDNLLPNKLVIKN